MTNHRASYLRTPARSLSPASECSVCICRVRDRYGAVADDETTKAALPPGFTLTPRPLKHRFPRRSVTIGFVPERLPVRSPLSNASSRQVTHVPDARCSVLRNRALEDNFYAYHFVEPVRHFFSAKQTLDE